MKKLIVLIVVILSCGCMPYLPSYNASVPSVTQPDNIIVPTNQVMPLKSQIIAIEPTLYIKDTKVSINGTTAIIMFATTIEALGKVTLLVNEHEYYSMYDVTPTKEHKLRFGGLLNGLNYTAVIDVATDKQLDHATISFISANSYTDGVSSQGNMWSANGYVAPKHYSNGNNYPD